MESNHFAPTQSHDRKLSKEDSRDRRSEPNVIAAEIVEDLQAALAQFAEIANDLKK